MKEIFETKDFRKIIKIIIGKILNLPWTFVYWFLYKTKKSVIMNCMVKDGVFYMNEGNGAVIYGCCFVNNDNYDGVYISCGDNTSLNKPAIINVVSSEQYNMIKNND